jgi:hypothetical protein
MRVVGIDVWEPSLALARANVAAEGVEGRVEVRRQDAAALDEQDAYALAWLPLMFLPQEMVDAALARIHTALAAGGWLVVGRFPSPPTSLGRALSALRTVRSGGHPWTDDDVEALLGRTGFGSVEHVPTAQVALTFARR